MFWGLPLLALKFILYERAPTAVLPPGLFLFTALSAAHAPAHPLNRTVPVS